MESNVNDSQHTEQCEHWVMIKNLHGYVCSNRAVSVRHYTTACVCDEFVTVWGWVLLLDRLIVLTIESPTPLCHHGVYLSTWKSCATELELICGPCRGCWLKGNHEYCSTIMLPNPGCLSCKPSILLSCCWQVPLLMHLHWLLFLLLFSSRKALLVHHEAMSL